jgi:hypothetical protein
VKLLTSMILLEVTLAAEPSPRTVPPISNTDNVMLTAAGHHKNERIPLEGYCLEQTISAAFS